MFSADIKSCDSHHCTHTHTVAMTTVTFLHESSSLFTLSRVRKHCNNQSPYNVTQMQNFLFFIIYESSCVRKTLLWFIFFSFSRHCYPRLLRNEKHYNKSYACYRDSNIRNATVQSARIAQRSTKEKYRGRWDSVEQTKEKSRAFIKKVKYDSISHRGVF